MEKRKETIEEERSYKKEKIKLEWDEEMIGVLIDKLNEDKESYLLSLSNYTCLIETSDLDYYFAKHMQRQIVFSIYRELKRYMDSYIDKTIDYIDRDKMVYYSANIKTKPFYIPKAYNVDINAAYPTCLFNNKMIDQRLYFKLMQLSKQERLAAIGMLASRKRRFKIIEGEVAEYWDDESQYSKYFFFCVQEISRIIFHCEITAGNSFIYSWVDGLYLSDKKAAEICRKQISDTGYKCTVSEITDFQYTPDDSKIRISFTKDKENKLFNIPIQNNSLSQILKFIHHEANQD